MSEEDAEVARRFYDAWNEGGPQAASELWTSDLEFQDPPDLPDSRVVRGREETVEYLQNQIRVIGEMKVEIVEAREVGDSLVVRMKLTVHGAESGLDVPGELMHVLEIDDGKLRRIRAFFNWEDALRAADAAD